MYDIKQCSICKYSVLLNENTYCCEYILIKKKRRGCYGSGLCEKFEERTEPRKAQITDGGFYYGGKWGKVEEHHVFSGPCRKTSDRYGFVVHLCRKCHSLIHDSEKGADMKLYLHQRGQMIYEERFGNRQAFIQEFIRSYL